MPLPLIPTKTFQQLGAEALPMRPEEFDAFLAADAQATGRIVRAANFKPQ
jgi:tripartite-type tricarboxylate transporter receptor subunit TctC